MKVTYQHLLVWPTPVLACIIFSNRRDRNKWLCLGPLTPLVLGTLYSNSPWFDTFLHSVSPDATLRDRYFKGASLVANVTSVPWDKGTRCCNHALLLAYSVERGNVIQRCYIGSDPAPNLRIWTLLWWKRCYSSHASVFLEESVS